MKIREPANKGKGFGSLHVVTAFVKIEFLFEATRKLAFCGAFRKIPKFWLSTR